MDADGQFLIVRKFDKTPDDLGPLTEWTLGVPFLAVGFLDRWHVRIGWSTLL